MTTRGAPLQFLRDVLSQPETDECIDWPFSRNEWGHGLVRLKTHGTAASRLMCIMAHGEPAHQELQAAHRCGRSVCINPKHIRWATAVENQADKVGHGTTNRGSGNARARLTEEAVAEIRSKFEAGERQYLLAREYGVSTGCIRSILKRKTWAWMR